MKRLLRHLFTLCSAASLVLCIAASLLLARSYNVLYALSRDDSDPRTGDVHGVRVVAATGRLTFSYSRERSIASTEDEPPTPGWKVYRDPYWFAQRTDMGFKLWLAQGRSFPGGSYYWVVGVNLLVVVALTAVLPIVWRIRFLRFALIRRRKASGKCVRCGYDLRASPGRCPECGTAIATL